MHLAKLVCNPFNPIVIRYDYFLETQWLIWFIKCGNTISVILYLLFFANFEISCL